MYTVKYFHMQQLLLNNKTYMDLETRWLLIWPDASYLCQKPFLLFVFFAISLRQIHRGCYIWLWSVFLHFFGFWPLTGLLFWCREYLNTWLTIVFPFQSYSAILSTYHREAFRLSLGPSKWHFACSRPSWIEKVMKFRKGYKFLMRTVDVVKNLPAKRKRIRGRKTRRCWLSNVGLIISLKLELKSTSNTPLSQRSYWELICLRYCTFEMMQIHFSLALLAQYLVLCVYL